MLHSPVLLEESIDFLITNPSGKYIDATFGRGGHSRKILDSITKDGTLLAKRVPSFVIESNIFLECPPLPKVASIYLPEGLVIKKSIDSSSNTGE